MGISEKEKGVVGCVRGVIRTGVMALEYREFGFVDEVMALRTPAGVRGFRISLGGGKR